MDPQYEFDEDKLKLVCINFSDEIVGDDEPGNCIGDWVKDGKYKSGNDKYKVVKY